MTSKEKVSRYDALQCAIKIMKRDYEARAELAKNLKEGWNENSPIYGFNYGQQQAYNQIASDLERWIDNE